MKSSGSWAGVDPELVAPLAAMPPVTITAETLPGFRSLFAEAALPAGGAPHAIERRIPGPPGAPDVRVVIADPSPGTEGRPALLHFHGGGFVAGTAGGDAIEALQAIATQCACVVISVDYRLAPETAFPGSLEDNYAALRWLNANAAQLGVDRNRIAVGGESAGGGHAAMLAIAARDRGEFALAFQLLIYPMLDDRTGSRRPVPSNLGQYIWNCESNQFGWTSLLGMPAGSDEVPAGSVPARVANLAGLPPAFIGAAALDLLADENIEYGRRLLNAGVPVELYVAPGAYHGFDVFAPSAVLSLRFTECWTLALRRALQAA